MSSAAKRQPSERVRARQCLALRLEGKSWGEIAETAGYRDRSGPLRAVERLLDSVENLDAGKYRTVESARLDALQGRFWSDALGGDLKAAEFVLKVSGQRAKLLGLNIPDRVIVAQAGLPSNEDYAATLAQLIADVTPAAAPTTEADAAEESDDWIDP